MPAIDLILYIVEWIGFFSFTVSATIVAVQKKADCVGACIYALLTSFGGGFMRDLILGIHPPHFLFDIKFFYFAIFSVVLSLIIYHLFFIDGLKTFISSHAHDFWIDFSDAIGLAVFCVGGVDIAARTAEGTANAWLLIFCGCLSGVGGGVLRDVCMAEIPALFRKHVYLLPALLGVSFYVCTYHVFHILPHLPSLLISVGLIVVVRVFAILFKWNLPIPGKEKK